MKTPPKEKSSTPSTLRLHDNLPIQKSVHTHSAETGLFPGHPPCALGLSDPPPPFGSTPTSGFLPCSQDQPLNPAFPTNPHSLVLGNTDKP